jgi:hypothetical protein
VAVLDGGGGGELAGGGGGDRPPSCFAYKNGDDTEITVTGVGEIEPRSKGFYQKNKSHSLSNSLSNSN